MSICLSVSVSLVLVLVLLVVLVLIVLLLISSEHLEKKIRKKEEEKNIPFLLNSLLGCGGHKSYKSTRHFVELQSCFVLGRVVRLLLLKTYPNAKRSLGPF